MRGSPPSSVLMLGISSGVPSSRLAALLALHRAKEPETPVSMEEVTSSPDLIEGVKNGGACQVSCRLSHAARGFFSAAA